ncbi:MAG: hypothetical protein GTO41_18550 [Burkholderiales bacterium]|nr:hypothetical protein [Burkholderiales bacterium]
MLCSEVVGSGAVGQFSIDEYISSGKKNDLLVTVQFLGFLVIEVITTLKMLKTTLHTNSQTT